MPKHTKRVIPKKIHLKKIKRDIFEESPRHKEKIGL